MPRRRSADATDAALAEACGSVQRAVALSSNARRHHHQQQQQQQQKAAPKSPQEGDIPYVHRADVVAAATAAGAAGASKEACQSLLRALALGKGAARPMTLPGASRPRRNSVTGGAMTAQHGLLAVEVVAESAEDACVADGAAAESVEASTSSQEKEKQGAEQPQQMLQMQQRPSPQSPAFSPLPLEAAGRFVAPYGQQLLRATAAPTAAGAEAPSPIAGAHIATGAGRSSNSGSPAASEGSDGSGALRSVLTRGSMRSAGSGSTGRWGPLLILLLHLVTSTVTCMVLTTWSHPLVIHCPAPLRSACTAAAPPAVSPPAPTATAAGAYS